MVSPAAFLAVALSTGAGFSTAATAAECIEVDLTNAEFETQRTNTINPAEALPFAFDGDIYTKWLDYAGGNYSTVVVTLDSAAAVTSYGIVSANDAADRDPTDWEFSASNDSGQTWTQLDEQTGVVFSLREQRHAFEVNFAGQEYQMYRLNITGVAGGNATELLQIAELELWAGSGCHDPCCGVDCGENGSCDKETGTCRFVDSRPALWLVAFLPCASFTFSCKFTCEAIYWR